MHMQAYGKARSQGTNEIGSVLLSISSDLLTFDFKETFVNAFDVRSCSCLPYAAAVSHMLLPELC